MPQPVIVIATSMGDAAAYRLGPYHYEIIYPWGEEDCFFGIQTKLQARMIRRIEELDGASELYRTPAA